MRIGILSDLHIDIASRENELLNWVGDVVVIPGDVCSVKSITDPDKEYLITNFFDRACKSATNVIYVFGNHEYYDDDILTARQKMQEYFDNNGFNNITILENETVNIDGITFFGATYWTNLNNGNPMAILKAKELNDFKVINNGGNLLTPEDTILFNQNSKAALTEVLNNNNNVFVVTHHAPSFQSVDEVFMNDIDMNYAFANSEEYFIVDHPNILCWAHGHMHNFANYNIGTTIVLCNPRGYNGMPIEPWGVEITI